MRDRPKDAVERCFHELKKRVDSSVEGLEIDYSPRLRISKMPWLNYITQTIYSGKIKKERRDNSIIHLHNQKLGTLLHFNDFSPCIIACHDIIEYVRPEYRSITVARAFIYAYHTGTMKADVIITPSKFTAEDIKRRFPKRSGRVEVVPNGVDHSLFRPSDRRIFLRQMGLPENRRYILFVGSEQPRKNVPAVVRTFIRARREFSNLTLLKIGGKHEIPGHPVRIKLQKNLKEAGLLDSALFLDNVSDEMMPYAYSSADALVFPSLYEGFGLPILEAMACGTPVVATNATAIPEVAGDAALLVTPGDDDALFDAVLRVLNDSKLHADLSTRGQQRAQFFNWDRSAQILLNIYHKLNPESRSYSN